MGILKTMGKDPWGERLKKIENSPNYRNGDFQNQSEPLVMNGGRDFFKVLAKMLNKPKDTVPPVPLSFGKPDRQFVPDVIANVVVVSPSSFPLNFYGEDI